MYQIKKRIWFAIALLFIFGIIILLAFSRREKSDDTNSVWDVKEGITEDVAGETAEGAETQICFLYQDKNLTGDKYVNHGYFYDCQGHGYRFELGIDDDKLTVDELIVKLSNMINEENPSFLADQEQLHDLWKRAQAIDRDAEIETEPCGYDMGTQCIYQIGNENQCFYICGKGNCIDQRKSKYAKNFFEDFMAIAETQLDLDALRETDALSEYRVYQKFSRASTDWEYEYFIQQCLDYMGMSADYERNARKPYRCFDYRSHDGSLYFAQTQDLDWEKAGLVQNGYALSYLYVSPPLEEDLRFTLNAYYSPDKKFLIIPQLSDEQEVMSGLLKHLAGEE